MQKDKLKVGILSLGCPRNLVDAESFLGRISAKGYEVTEIEKADVGIINTCSFIDDAKAESVDAILDLINLKKEGKLKKIIVCGCLTQRYKEELASKLPEVDAFIGIQSLNHSLKRYPLTPEHFVYLKICESCVNNCSYCVIPGLKGKFSSIGIESVLQRVEIFNRQKKVSELNIIGQDITGYGLDLSKKRMLPELLKKIVKAAPDIGWIRLLYLYPGEVIEPLIDLMKEEPKICRYMDLPVQHINSRILKLMRRRTKKADILRLIKRIRKELPNAAIRTSIIVGFPSETDAEFKELLKFMEDLRFERLGAFIYSRQEGTPAYNLPGQIPQSVKSERFDAVMSLQQEISRVNNEKLLGKELEVLIDEKEGEAYLGRTQYDAPEVDGLVYVNSKKKLKSGDFAKVKITDTLEYDLVGEVR